VEVIKIIAQCIRKELEQVIAIMLNSCSSCVLFIHLSMQHYLSNVNGNLINLFVIFYKLARLENGYKLFFFYAKRRKNAFGYDIMLLKRLSQIVEYKFADNLKLPWL